jgi:large subunit ribosomal protein L24
MGLRIKKNDTVYITTGKEKGKSGRVISFSSSKGRVLIEKINIVKKHMKPTRKYTQGGIIEKEATVHVSNVMLVCPKCNKPTRIRTTFLQDERKVRTCRKCNEVIDE